MNSNDALTVKGLLDRAKDRVDRRTFIQDVTEPSTGRADERKIAAKFNNLEHAIDELATAVELVADDADTDRKSA